MVLRFRYRLRGAHMHCRVFTATAPGQTLGKVGELVLPKEEWHAFRGLLANGLGIIEFLEEDYEQLQQDFPPTRAGS